MRGIHKLTAAAVRNKNKPGLYGDGGGLYLQVSQFQTKAWVYRFMIDGRARTMGLGPLHTISLSEARERAQAARKAVLDGIDPIDTRRETRAQRRLEAAKAVSFAECAEKYIAAHEAGWRNEKHAAQWKATFNETRRGKLIFPAATKAINDLPVAAIDTGLVLKVLEPIWREKPETANRVRGRIEAVLNWATTREYRSGDNPARWRGHLENTLPRRSKIAKVKHQPALPYADIPAFMADLRERTGVSALALEFTILTAARTGETVGAKWSEFDLAAKVWTVPAERMKGGQEHRVPLSDRAIEILGAVPRGGEFVFPGAKARKPLSNMAMLELTKEMAYPATNATPDKIAVPHGMRSTFKDWATELTAYPNEMSEMALAHKVSDKVEAAYRRADMLEKRRRLMADWAAYCAQPPHSARADNVVAMRGA